MTRFASIAWILLLGLVPGLSLAQSPLDANLLQRLEGLNGGGVSTNPNVTLSAEFVVDPAKTHGRIDLKATVGNNWALYSTTQPRGGPMQTRLKVADHAAIAAVGEFTPDRDPKIVPPDQIIRVRQEKFYEQVIWSAPFTLAAGVDPEGIELPVSLNGQSCHDRGTCVPITVEAVARFGGWQPVELDAALASQTPPQPAMAPLSDYELEGTPGDFTPQQGHAVISGTVTPAVVAPGEELTVTLTVNPADDYHVYAYAPTDSTIGFKTTQIALAEVTPWLALQPKTSSPVIEKEGAAGLDTQRYHEGPTTWTFTVQVPIDAAPGRYPLVGYLGYQLCTDTTCDRPAGAKFEALVEVDLATDQEVLPLAFTEASYREAADRAKRRNAAVQDESTDLMAPPAPQGEAEVSDNDIAWTVLNPPEASSLGWIILFSFIGGGILNLMPCVLPVVGLKILSFVNQAGKNRGAVFKLNLVYSLGVISVFMVLAVLASSVGTVVSTFWAADATAAEGAGGMAWGQWSGDWRYILPMIVLVYTMGLSMLGVWELALPSFLGSGSAANMSNQSGFGGAFFKGVLTTLLSTPCSGPFLGPVFGYTITQPAYVTFLVFGFIGLGMASPYLIIGMNPRLIAFLPKPGNWMVAFKQAMGFVMMLTVVYLVYTLEDKWVVPTLTLLVALGAGCWMLGQMHLLESKGAKAATALGAVGLSIGIGFFAFTTLVDDGTHAGAIAWDTYVEDRWPNLENDILARQAAGKTVMVDFTADWCPTCKWNYATAINTDQVGAVVEEEGIVPMLVDWTNSSHPNGANVQRFLNKLGTNSIPVLAIFPGGRPGEVLVLSDLLTQDQVLDNLQQAQRQAASVPRQTAMQD